MLCRAKFNFIKGPLQGRNITHDFEGSATVAQVKKFLTETHQACDSSQSLVLVWEEESQRLNNEDQAVSSLGPNISITVNVVKRRESAPPTTPPASAPLASASPAPVPSASSLQQPCTDATATVVDSNALSTPSKGVLEAKVQPVPDPPATTIAPASVSTQPASLPQVSSAELKTYKIRVRKSDNQNVVMSGSLPADSTLQTLADEIVKLGHATADTFSILLPPYQRRPPTVYEPKDFTTSLESCGVFGAQMGVTLQKFGKVDVSAPSGSAKQLGSTPPFPNKIPVPPELKNHVKSNAIRRAAELAFPHRQEVWGTNRFGSSGVTLDEEKRGCIAYFEQEEAEMTQLLQNIWKGLSWPDAGCKSSFAKVACQLIVEQMHLIHASVAPGPNHKGQLCSECDLELCKHAGSTSNREHWSCCGHKRHEPCIPPSVPASPQTQISGDDESSSVLEKLMKGSVGGVMMPKVAGDFAKLIVTPDECGFPGTTLEEKKNFFLTSMVPQLHLNAGACEEFIKLTKEEPSREWDLPSALALCPDEQNQDQISGAHTGQWRRLSDGGLRYKCSIPGNEDGTLCSHDGGIIGSDHWSCCGKLSEKAPCSGSSTNSSATAKFLVKVSECIKNPDQQQDLSMEAVLEAAAAAAASQMKGLFGSGGLFGGGGGGGPTKPPGEKPKSKYQFK